MSHVTLLTTLEERLKPYRLRILSPPIAGVRVNWAESAHFDTVLLVGAVGSDYWPIFEISDEYADGLADPLDRWSRRIGHKVTSGIECKILHPSDGPPYWPFLSWSKSAGQTSSSPLGLHINNNHGLWRAYRFAVAFASQGEIPDRAEAPAQSPCDRCTARPCLTTCPVNAFSEGGYDVEQCSHYLVNNPHSPCRSSGCQARIACPIGTEFRYTSAHAQFHMREFLKSHPEKD